MKRIILIVLFMTALLASNNGNCQEFKMEKVQIIHAGSRSVKLVSTFFNQEIKEQLLAQITKEEFELVKKRCLEKKYPSCIKSVLERNANLEGVVIRRIATFDNIRNGNNYGKKAVLRISPKDNPEPVGIYKCSIDKVFYIILNDKDVTVNK